MNSPQRLISPRKLRALFLGGLVALGLSGLGAQDAHAGTFQIADGNSVVDFDTSSQANATNWTVDGQDQLYQQAFWYRIGNAPEQSLDTLPIPTEGTTDTDFDGDDDTLFVHYSPLDASFDIEVRYRLQGGVAGSGASDMSEQISITNNTLAPLNFHFFQYSDFDLQGTSGGDQALFTNANTVRQYEGVARLTETVVTPVPNHREISPFSVIRDKLNDGVASNLSDTPPIGTIAGPGDMTWAYQWDVSIAPQSTFQISKDKNLSAGVIPEPATLALLLMVGGLLPFRRRQR